MYKFTHKLSYSTLILSLKKLSSNRKIHHFLVVYILSLAISFLLALNPVFSLASELPKAWQKFATLNQDTREIYTIFSQEKYFAFLKKPLRSAGELYFAKGSKNNFTLLWAYNKPLVSGFYYKDEQIWLLDPQKPHFRLAKNQEKQAISGAINTILPWMTGDIKLVSQKFNLAAGQDENSFCAQSKSGTSKLIFSYDASGLLKTLEILDEGERTILTFSAVKKNSSAPRTFNGEPLP